MALRFDSAPQPMPPADLIGRVLPFFDAGAMDHNRVAFDTGAPGHLRQLEAATGLVGRAFSDFERVLDFGCGPGRFLRHLAPLAAQGTELHGCDVDADAIAWLQANLDHGTWVVSPDEPPLPYADGFFDLVLIHSVFTHIDARMQDLWLAELERVVRPGGIVLASVEDLATFDQALGDWRRAGEPADDYRARLEADGILFIDHDAYTGSTHPPYYHSTFHAPWYVHEHWTQWFDVAGYVQRGSHGQDLWVLRRREAGVGRIEPIGHRGAASAPTAPAASPLPARLRAAAQRVRAPAPDVTPDAALERRLAMLEHGLYEQARRTSVIAAELRQEIGRVGGGASVHAFRPAGDHPEIMALEDDGAFVDAAYELILGREPDPTGRAHHVEALDAGAATRRGVLIALSGSDEARARRSQG